MRSLLAIALLATSLLANGTIRVNGDRPGVIVLVRHSVSAQIVDQLAAVTVEQVFLSRGTQRVEGVYLFPLPPGASVSAFEMTVDGTTMRGEVIEREKAQRIYEGIVQQKRDPALLEMIDDETYRARVFPIDPGKEVSIRLTYHQLLDDHNGNLELRYPLARDRLASDEVAQIDLSVQIESSIDLFSVSSPSHTLKIAREGERSATLTLTGGTELQSKDLQVQIRRDPDAIGLTLLGHREAGEPGTFLAILSPPTRLPDASIPARDLVYVVDTSGSMGGEKLNQAKAALRRGVSLLRARDRFRLIAFSTGVNSFRREWTEASEESKGAALAWIDRLSAAGGTAIDDALTEALATADSGRLTLMVFLTDGLPTIGERDRGRIVANAAARNRAAMRIFCFGVGFDLDRPLLDELARSTRATREQVTEGQDIEATLVRFFDRVQQPALTDLRIEWGGGAREVYPHPLPDLFAGDRLVVAGRYDVAGPCLIKLHGRRLGEPLELVYEGSLPAEGGVSAVPRLWAQRKIDFLLAEMQRNGARSELKNEVVALATRHGIVTPYTAGLVVEDEMSESEAPYAGPSTNSAIGLSGSAGGARRSLRAGGRSGMTEQSVEGGLAALSQAQGAGGSWGSGGADQEVESSALALLAFLGAGYTDRGSESENKCVRCVREGLRFLLVSQDDEGCFSATGDLRSHAAAALAMSEAYWMTRNPRYRAPAQAALNYLATARTPDGGWGDDTLTTIWAMIVLHSGKQSGLEVDPDGFEGTRLVLNACAGSLPPAEAAAALFARILMGEDPRQSAALRAQADALLNYLPVWREGESPPVDLWYFGSLAMFQMGGSHWRKWSEALVTALAPERMQGAVQALPAGDRAKLEMCLEVYYRYARVFGVR